MTKENYLKLKQELKELVKKIREEKNLRKFNNKNLSKFQKETNVSLNSFFEGRISSSFWNEHKNEYYTLCEKLNSSRREANSLSDQYRHMHVFYCLERGRKYGEIEQKVHEGNELSEIFMNNLKLKYT
jgi:hypothetical protein